MMCAETFYLRLSRELSWNTLNLSKCLLSTALVVSSEYYVWNMQILRYSISAGLPDGHYDYDHSCIAGCHP